MIDTIDLELFQSVLGSILDEVEHSFSKTAYSRLIHDYHDYCVGFLDDEFRLIAASAGGLPLLGGDLGGPVRDSVEIIGAGNLGPDDVFITNYGGALGQHLNNGTMAQPIVVDGQLIGYMAIRGHWVDIGGITLGSMGWNGKDIYSEGTQYRALEVVRDGKVVPGALATFLANSRMPVMMKGDFYAQLGMVNLGVRRWTERVAAVWSRAESVALMREQLDRSEAVARLGVRKMRPGRYEASCQMDDDPARGTPVLDLKVIVRIDEDTMEIDFTEMPDQVKAPVNSGEFGGAVSMAKMAFKALVAPSERSNDGLFRPLTIETRPGSIVSADDEAPKARWNNNTATIVDLVLRAIGTSTPEIAPAGHHGSIGSCTFYGLDREGQRWEYGDSAMGGWGGWSGGDGHSALRTITHGDTPGVPVEVVEGRYPLRFERFEFVPDSAGDGEHRGGWGTERIIEVLAPVTVNTAMDRTLDPPWGLNGGLPGTPGDTQVRPPEDEEWHPIRKVTGLALSPGTKVRVRIGGGGGWGDPARRPPELRERDRRAGLAGGTGD